MDNIKQHSDDNENSPLPSQAVSEDPLIILYEDVIDNSINYEKIDVVKLKSDQMVATKSLPTKSNSFHTEIITSSKEIDKVDLFTDIKEHTIQTLENSNLSSLNKHIVSKILLINTHSVQKAYEYFTIQKIIYENSPLNFMATNGDDVFIGRKGSDTVILSEDTDNSDTDYIVLKEGNDLIYSSVSGYFDNNSFISTGAGNDKISFIDTEWFEAYDTYVDLGTGDDVIEGNNIYFDDLTQVNTGSGNDIIKADEYFGIWSAHVNMGDGNDSILGYLDLGWAGEGPATLDMGRGNDLIDAGISPFFDVFSDSIINMGLGNDIINIRGVSDLTIDGSIKMGEGNDLFLGTGENMYFDGSDSYIDMGAGDDVFNFGTVGEYNFYNADIRLGEGNDTIYIKGTGEIKNIEGNAGSDLFIFSGIGGDKTIADFSIDEEDIIDISQILSGYAPLSDPISDFVRFVDSGADTILQVDANGGADNFVSLVFLSGNAGLDAATLEASGHLDTLV